jgi:glucose/arabinose dehydrogenase
LLGSVLTFGSLEGCGGSDSPSAPPPTKSYEYELQRVYPAVAFENPVDLSWANDHSGRLFVVEKRGRILALDPADSLHASVFLDIADSVYSQSAEMGLLGLAFRPDFATSRWFYGYYTVSDASGYHSRLSRFTAAADGLSAPPSSEVVLRQFDEPYVNHNGGGMCFGQGTQLYLGVGDGGYGGDPTNSAQDRSRYLGKILRLDVGSNETTPPYYAIPSDNPFRGNSQGFKEEIFAYGLRNPWRISFDDATGELWAGEVGQAQWEEVDRIMAGGNYGWDCREGAHDYLGPPDGPSPVCSSAGPFLDPLYEYPHTEGNTAITGGYVVRGHGLSSLQGRYVFGDYSSGRIWAVSHDGSEVQKLLDASFPISSFGVDENGALYVVEYATQGGIYRLEEKETTP